MQVTVDRDHGFYRAVARDESGNEIASAWGNSPKEAVMKVEWVARVAREALRTARERAQKQGEAE